MKKKNTELGLVPVARGAVAAQAPDFAEVLADIGGLADGRVAERVRKHLASSSLFGRLSLAHAITAGWLLYTQKIHTRYGLWQAWCRDELGVSQKTADRYIGLFAATVGAAREKDGIPFENPVGERELEFATYGMEDKSATGAMVELGIVRRNPDHGGAREGAGRPAANPDPAADAVKVWTLAAEGFRRITPTSYRFLPLREAEGIMVELDAVRDRLRARIAELKSSAEVAP